MVRKPVQKNTASYRGCAGRELTQRITPELHSSESLLCVRSGTAAGAPSISVMPEKSEVSHLARFMWLLSDLQGPAFPSSLFYVKPGKLALMKQSEGLSHLSPLQS